MPEKLEQLKIDEQDAISRAVSLMLSECPIVKAKKLEVHVDGLPNKAEVIGVFPIQGAVYLSKYISGGFVAQFPFQIRYRIKASERDDARRIDAANMLDKIGRWFSGQEVAYGGKAYSIDEYPALTERRTICGIERSSTAFLSAMAQDGTTDFQINMQLKYVKG